MLGGLGGSGVGLVVAAIGSAGITTGAAGSGPLYVPFGISTLKQQADTVAVMGS